MTEHQFFATCPKSLEGLLLQEIQQLGATDLRETVAGVYFSGSLEIAYRVCLWSRLANKVLLPLKTFSVKHQDDLYEGTASIAWQDHLRPNGTLLIDFIGMSDEIRNTQFGAVKMKDAIVDSFRQSSGERPSVAKRDPDLLINARLSKDKLIVSIDLSGDSLHRRGYRTKQGAAPLKENLAAAILLRAQWPQIASEGGALLDPMCGSGTFLVEAGLMAADIAPGLLRANFGFERWLNHESDAWLNLRDEAHTRKKIGLEKELPEIRGYDADLHVIRAAEENIISAGLDDWIRVTRKELIDFKKPTHKNLSSGLILTNPPYGERLGEIESLKLLYNRLGEQIRTDFQGWRAAIFTGNPELGKQMGLRAEKKYKFFNGTIESELLTFSIDREAFSKSTALDNHEANPKDKTAVQEKEFNLEAQRKAISLALSENAKSFFNRLQKNFKHLEKWAARNKIHAYRVYDADIPEYSAAIDLFYGQAHAGQAPLLYAHVQEYAAPKTIDENKAIQRFNDIKDVVPLVLGIPDKQISYKQRRRNKGTQQYEKMSEVPEGDLFFVQEGDARLHINLWQYLDAGLFLDHRPVRLNIADMVKDKRFLNLFCYTATASVHAALAGAKFTLSVDMSNTYLNWARKNFALNGLSESKNRLEQADCLKWLEENTQQFDLILLDPPSFSNSKRMEDVLDIQRDHVNLISLAMRSLSEQGTLIFSNNLRSFKMDKDALSDYTLEDISAVTLDEDFKKNPKIHQCWLIKH